MFEDSRREHARREPLFSVDNITCRKRRRRNHRRWASRPAYRQRHKRREFQRACRQRRRRNRKRQQERPPFFGSIQTD